MPFFKSLLLPLFIIIDLRNGLCLSIKTLAIIALDEYVISSNIFFNLLFSDFKNFESYFSSLTCFNSSSIKLKLS